MNNTIVIRGKIFEHTQKTVNSIRTWFDGELILSTWEEQDTQITGIDKLVTQRDPGPGPVQQAARQIYSYKAGLESASNDLIMVTRSDIVHNKNLFHFYNTLNQYDEKFKIFDSRLIVSNMMTINPEKSHSHIPTEKDKYFRVCDWFQVGIKKDLFKWANVLDVFDRYKNLGLCTEQLWFCGLIQENHFPILESNDIMKYKFLFWDYLINNFQIINMKTTGDAVNLNWQFQPENLGCYLMENEYNEKYIKMFGTLK
jgi:hypothetical protein